MSAAVAKPTKKTETEETQAPAVESKAPPVKSASVQVDVAGHLTRHVVARMPEGLVIDDLRDPRIWRVVQGVPQSALVKLDRLLILGFDESWGAEAIVKSATASEAHIQVLKVFSFDGIGDRLFYDDQHEVHWNGSSYDVRRRTDRVVVAGGYGSEGLAIDGLRRQYPRKVGS